MVVFTDETTSLKHRKIDLILQQGDRNGLEVTLERRTFGEKKFQVFDPSSEEGSKLISGKIATMLASVSNENQLYSVMPLRFDSVMLKSKDLLNGGTIKNVYANYMSHVNYEVRKLYSGPLKVVANRVQHYEHAHRKLRIEFVAKRNMTKKMKPKLKNTKWLDDIAL